MRLAIISPEKPGFSSRTRFHIASEEGVGDGGGDSADGGMLLRSQSAYSGDSSIGRPCLAGEMLDRSLMNDSGEEVAADDAEEEDENV
jgi:hypothetical protein